MPSPTARVAAPPPRGCLFIPAIAADVPVRLDPSAARSRILARFCRASAAAGVPLPSGEFRGIEEVLRAQWLQQLQRCMAPQCFAGAPATPAFQVDDQSLQVVIGACADLTVYRLKPVVEALEASRPGLGWFVHGVLAAAPQHALQLYDTGFTTCLLDGLQLDLDAFSDECYARMLLSEQGDAPPPDQPVPAECIDALREQYAYWPSQLLRDVDGHAHLLGHWGGAGGCRPAQLTPARAAHWLRTHSRHAAADLVRTALALEAACRRDSKRAFAWYREDDLDSVGALCFLAWDQPAMLLEAVSHHEQNTMNGGQAEEAFARCAVLLDARAFEKRVCALARATAAYFERWGLLAKLLSFFPVWVAGHES
jgi:PRTRC genetic system protein F